MFVLLVCVCTVVLLCFVVFVWLYIAFYYYCIVLRLLLSCSFYLRVGFSKPRLFVFVCYVLCFECVCFLLFTRLDLLYI